MVNKNTARKLHSLFAYWIVLFLVSASLQYVSLASGNGIPALPIQRIYIKNDGSIEPASVPIMRNGDVYTLTDEMSNSSIVVQRDNIVIDGAGHGIHGHSTSYHEGIIISYRTNVTIKNMDISPFGHAVLASYASNNTITGNRMQAFTGVSLLYSDYNQIYGNVMTDGYGVQGSGSYNLIVGNNFTSGLSGGGNGMGIYLSGNNNTISQNTIVHEVSINLGTSHYNTISYNTILGGRSGILLVRSSCNSVFGNIIKDKTDSRSGGLYISEASNNTVYENQFEDNALAISLGAQVASSVWNKVHDNIFYRNNFKNNTQDVWIAPGAPVNFWDNDQEGNYWSSFQGTDTNGDGISDIAYVINSNNTDRYPLMNLASASTSPVPSSTPSPSPTPLPSQTPLPTSPLPSPSAEPLPPISPSASLTSPTTLSPNPTALSSQSPSSSLSPLATEQPASSPEPQIQPIILIEVMIAVATLVTASVATAIFAYRKRHSAV